MICIRIIHFLACTLILMILMSSMGHAFYHSGNIDSDFSFAREKTYASFSEGKRRFAVYDNFGHSMKEYDGKSIISPYCNKFVPADLIDFNTHISITVQCPVTPEDALAGILYADLKLKKLYDELEALQQRSRELLVDLDIPDLVNLKLPCFVTY